MSSKDGGGDWDDKNYPKEMSQDHDAMSLVLFVCMCVRERETVCVSVYTHIHVSNTLLYIVNVNEVIFYIKYTCIRITTQ